MSLEEPLFDISIFAVTKIKQRKLLSPMTSHCQNDPASHNLRYCGLPRWAVQYKGRCTKVHSRENLVRNSDAMKTYLSASHDKYVVSVSLIYQFIKTLRKPILKIFTKPQLCIVLSRVILDAFIIVARIIIVDRFLKSIRYESVMREI